MSHNDSDKVLTWSEREADMVRRLAKLGPLACEEEEEEDMLVHGRLRGIEFVEDANHSKLSSSGKR